MNMSPSCVNSNSRIISTDEDPSLRIESSAIINLRGVSTKLNKYIVFTMQTYKKLMSPSLIELAAPLVNVATLIKRLELYRKLVVDCLTESIHFAGRHYSPKLLQG